MSKICCSSGSEHSNDAPSGRGRSRSWTPRVISGAGSSSGDAHGHVEKPSADDVETVEALLGGSRRTRSEVRRAGRAERARPSVVEVLGRGDVDDGAGRGALEGELDGAGGDVAEVERLGGATAAPGPLRLVGEHLVHGVVERRRHRRGSARPSGEPDGGRRPGNAERTGGRSMPKGSLDGRGSLFAPVCIGVISTAADHSTSSKSACSQPCGWRRASNDSSGRQATSPGTATGCHASPRRQRQVRSLTIHSDPISASNATDPAPRV